MRAFRLAVPWLFVAAAAAEPVDVLVQGAEKLEVSEVIAALGASPEKSTLGPFDFWFGQIGPHRVAISLTGQALINCTAATVLAIEAFHPRLIVNQGTSGAQRRGLRLNDIVVGARVLDYGGFAAPPRGVGEGSRPLEWIPAPERLPDRAGNLIAFSRGFPGDPEALAVALRTVNPAGRVVAGTIGSAHEVNLELDRVGWSNRTFGMDVEEMESGPVGAIARAYNVRYIAFRVVSDAPYDGVPFHPEAARTTGRFTVKFLQQLPPLGREP